MKKRTKPQKIQDCFDAYKALRDGTRPKRSRRKDWSIGTKPKCPVIPKPESEVLKDCILWLREHHILADRMNVGAGDMGGGFHTYGIVGGGDIFAVIPPEGQHLEVECKAGKGGTWSCKQQRRCRRVMDAGGLYLLVHGVEELEMFMERYL